MHVTRSVTFLSLVLIGCSAPAKNEGTSAPPPATGDGGSTDAGPPSTDPDASITTTIDPAAKRTTCPTDKPQKVYGYALDADAILEKDETWTKDNVYLIFGPFHTGKHSLTIEAGTHVCFDYGPPGVEGSSEPPPGSLEVSEGGTLRITGTAQEHAVLSQKNAADQYWAGIYYAAGSKIADSTMQNVDVYNAGLSAGIAPISTFPDFKGPPMDLQNVVFRSLQRRGLELLTSGVTAKSRIVVYEYAEETKDTALAGYPALKMHPIGATTLDDQRFTVGPTVPKQARFVQWTFAGAGGIGVDTHFHKLQDGLAYALLPTKVKVGGDVGGASAVMTLDPGVVIAMPPSAPLQFGDGSSKGDLVAVGTAQQPVIFTSQQPSPAAGDWNSVIFVPGAFDPKTSQLDHVRFEYGAGQGPDRIYSCQDSQQGDGAVAFETPLVGGNYEGPSITNTTFTKMTGNGIRGYCNVGPSNCLTTDYTGSSLGNVFDGFASTTGQTKLGCP